VEPPAAWNDLNKAEEGIGMKRIHWGSRSVHLRRGSRLGVALLLMMLLVLVASLVGGVSSLGVL
jgi:hypothetical protein